MRCLAPGPQATDHARVGLQRRWASAPSTCAWSARVAGGGVAPCAGGAVVIARTANEPSRTACRTSGPMRSRVRRPPVYPVQDQSKRPPGCLDSPAHVRTRCSTPQYPTGPKERQPRCLVDRQKLFQRVSYRPTTTHSNASNRHQEAAQARITASGTSHRPSGPAQPGSVA